MEGFNNTNLPLIWEFTASSSKYSVVISRQRRGGTGEEQIAKRNESSWFSFVNDSYRADYDASPPETLRLRKVQRGEEYVYTLSILDESGVLQVNGSVTVQLLGKYKLAVAMCVSFTPRI